MASKNFSHIGKVVSVDGRRVVIEFSAQGACAGCAASAKCGMVDSSTRQVEVAVNPGEVYVVGEEVQVAISYKMGIMSVVIAYVIPLIILMAILCGAAAFGVNEGLSALLSLGAVAIYYIVVYFMRNKLDKQIKFTIEK